MMELGHGSAWIVGHKRRQLQSARHAGPLGFRLERHFGLARHGVSNHRSDAGGRRRGGRGRRHRCVAALGFRCHKATDGAGLVELQIVQRLHLRRAERRRFALPDIGQTADAHARERIPGAATDGWRRRRRGGSAALDANVEVAGSAGRATDGAVGQVLDGGAFGFADRFGAGLPGGVIDARAHRIFE